MGHGQTEAGSETALGSWAAEQNSNGKTEELLFKEGFTYLD